MSRRRLLVVDDDAKFLRFVTELLIGAGYDVRGAGDALSALSLALEFRPELVIVDVAMPGKDGFELARELRSTPATSAVPCLFLTARSSREGAGAAREAGAVGYLEKPVRSGALLWTIKALLVPKDNAGGGTLPRKAAP